MQTVPLIAKPSQTVGAVLGGQSCKIDLITKNTGMFINLYVNDVLIIGGVLAENRNRIVRSDYLGFIGDLAFFDLQGGDDPVYTALGTRFILLYLDPADIVPRTFDLPFFTPLP